MSKLRVFTLVPLLTVAVLFACTPSATSDIESIVSSDVSVEDAAAATVKAMSIEGAVQATLEAMAPDATETPATPIGKAPTPDNQSVSNPTVVTNIAATSTVTESTGAVTPTATVVIEVPEPTSTVTSVSVSSLSAPVVQVATPTSIVSASIETVTATAVVIPTIVPSPVAVPTPIPEPTATPTPTPVPLNYNIIEGTTPIGTSGYNYSLQGFSVEDYDLISDLVSTQIKWGDSNDYQQVSVMQGTGEILANHTFTSGGSFYGEIRLVSISTGEVLASVPITIVMNLGDIPTAVPTSISVIDVVTPTSTVSAGATPTFTPTIGPSPTPTVTPTPAPPADPVYDKIVFAEKDEVHGRRDIFIMDSDGSNKTNLTNTPDCFDERNPKFSPSGNKIVFYSGAQCNNEGGIWVMDPDGANRKQVTIPTSGGYSDTQPDWSPDGTKILYKKGRVPWIMNSDGSNPAGLVQGGPHNCDGTVSEDQHEERTYAVFSPVGNKIAYQCQDQDWEFLSVSSRSTQIYVMNADGSNKTKLTNSSHPAMNFRPAWSPDGSKIAYVHSSDGLGGNSKSIWVMNADGSNATNLNVTPVGTGSGGFDSPSWSPDGSKIIFYVENYGSDWQDYNGLYVMNADGSNVAKLAGGTFASNCSPQPCGGFSIHHFSNWGPAAP